MADLSPIEKLKIIEDDFQKWFRKAYELKDYTDVDIDFLVDNLPRAKLQMQRREGLPRYLFYKTRFKNTIKVPPQFQDTPKLFINALGKYFVDSAKFLYKDQIRYEYLGARSSDPGESCNIAVYKSCADEVGCFIVTFQLEGNLVVVEAGFQIFQQILPLLSAPNSLSVFTSKSLAVSGRSKIFRYVPKTMLDFLSSIKGVVLYFSWFVGFVLFLVFFLVGSMRNLPAITDVLSFVWVVLGLVWIATLSLAFSFVLFALPVDFMLGILKNLVTFFFDSPEVRLVQQETAIQQDLSPIHFPVKYFNHEDLNEAYTNSHDHQIFFNQLESVVNQMSALGESANRAE